MDWFGNLVKATQDYLRDNGLVLIIVIVLTASITTILGYAIPAFGRFMHYLPQRICGGWRMFRKWCYWKRYHPNYTFINKGEAIINETASAFDGVNNYPSYVITIEVSLCIKNNDNLNTLHLTCGQGLMSLKMCSDINQRAKYKLFLSNQNTPYKVIANKERTLDFVLTTDSIDMKPPIGSKVHCIEINIGIVQLSGMTYKLKYKPFDVKVDWSKIQQSENKK